MYSPFKMKPKSPILKALVGKQNNLPAELKAKILASPATMKKESMAPMKKESMAKMKKESSIKMMKKSPAKEKSVEKGLYAKGTPKTQSFNDAFASARKAGKDTFMYKDKEYHTAKKGEGKIYKASYDKGASYSVVDKSGKIARFGESSTSPSKMKKESSMKMKKKSMAKMRKPEKIEPKRITKETKRPDKRRKISPGNKAKLIKVGKEKGSAAKMAKKSPSKMMKKSPSKMMKKK